MKYFSTIANACKEVYSKPSYYVVTILGGLLLMSLNAVFRNYSLLWHNFSFSLLFSLIMGLIDSLTVSAFILLSILSLLGGMVLAMSIFLIRRQWTMSASVGLPGIIIAILAPACPSCALGLLSTLGVGGILAFLPFGGTEFGILGVVILIMSIGYLSRKIVTKTCELKQRNKS